MNVQSSLELHLMSFYPEQYLPLYVHSVQDLYVLRQFLKCLPHSSFTVDYIATVILNALTHKQRFRTLECLKILKAITKKQHFAQIDDQTALKLFTLYQRFIFSEKIDLQWCVSVFIKDIVLPEAAIAWLIEHHAESDHIINRLLRYPTPHRLITEWAQTVYLAGDLNQRKSEVIARLIITEIPKYVDCSDTTSMLWAIYYAQISTQLKEELLLEFCTLNSVDAVIEIARRLGYPSMIEKLVTTISSHSAPSQRIS